jgi:hypothetical protein
MVNVSGFVESIKHGSKSCRNEEEFRHKFLSSWQQLIHDLGYSDSIRIEERIVKGKADARFRSLVFEFKNPAKPILSSVQGQKDTLSELRSHLDQYVQKGINPQDLKGLATDGEYIASLSYDTRSQRFVVVDEFERHVRDENAFFAFAQASLMIEGVIDGLAKRELTPENLLEKFGPSQEICRRSMAGLWLCLETHSNEPRIHAFYETWKLLFSLSTRKVASGQDLAQTLDSYGLKVDNVRTEEDVRRFLFILHTYYSLLLKFLAVAVADELKLVGETELLARIQRDPIAGLESAEKVLPTLVANVVEKDVFSWFEGFWDAELVGIIKLLATEMSNFDLRGLRRDVLKRVYQNLIPAKLRKSLGEFYTKDWTADLLLDAVGYDGNGRILDPACGSGTFLTLAIERMRRCNLDLTPDLLLRKISESIVGFDVNPMAVLTARINYLLATYDLIKRAANVEKVELPVYLCDSVSVPSEVPDLHEKSVYEIHNPDPLIGTFRLPKDSGVLRLLQVLEKNVGRSVDLFLADVESELGVDFVLGHKLSLRTLHGKLTELDIKHVNSIWCRFLTNFFHPLIVSPFDFVVGNPPWVAPERVPQEYRNKIFQMMKRSGFLLPYNPHFIQKQPGFKGASEQFTACLPFMARALENYLKPKGRLAFLLTSSLLRSLNAGGFREQLGIFNLERIDDLTLHTKIHEGATCWAFIPVVVNEKTAVPKEISYNYYIPRKEPREPEKAPDFLVKTWKIKRKDLLLDVKSERSPWFCGPKSIVNVFRKMQSHMRLGDRYRLSMGIKTSANNIYFLESIRRTEPGIVAANTIGGKQVNLEDSTVFPLVRGRNIRAWNFDYKYVLVPHTPPSWTPIPEAVAVQQYKEMYEHVAKKEHKKILLARDDYAADKGPFYMIFRLSRSKVEKWKVAYAEVGTRLEACVIPSKLQDEIIGERNIMVDHSAYFITCEKKEEALYLTAILNSAPVRAFSYCFGRPKGGVPFRAFTGWTVSIIPFPSYNKDDDSCAKIVELSQRATNLHDSDELPEVEESIDVQCARLYGLSDSELSELRSHYLTLSGQSVTKSHP